MPAEVEKGTVAPGMAERTVYFEALKGNGLEKKLHDGNLGCSLFNFSFLSSRWMTCPETHHVVFWLRNVIVGAVH